MAGQEIEIILSRQWAEYLSIPVFITDTEGNLLFYNEPAEEIFGKRFEESGPMPMDEWSTIFNPQDKEGNRMPPDVIPLFRTLSTQQPAQGSLWIENFEGKRHHLSVTSFPIIGLSAGYLGAIAIFWKNDTHDD